MNFEEAARTEGENAPGAGAGASRGGARRKPAAKKKSRGRAKKNCSGVIPHSTQETTMSTMTNVSSKHLIFRLAPDPAALWESLVNALMERPRRDEGCQGSSDWCGYLWLQFSDADDQSLWDGAEPLARALWLLGRLHGCNDVAPDRFCRDAAWLKAGNNNPLELFNVSKGSTYNQLVCSLQLGLR